MDFSAFKSGPAGNVLAGLGEQWTDLLHRSKSFEHLRRSVVIRNVHSIGSFVIAARRYAKRCSINERRLLLAVCTVCDFGHLADELAATAHGRTSPRDATYATGPLSRPA